VRTAGIAGLGCALPDRVVPNAEVAPRLGVDEAWIERRTGIRSRRHLADGERLSDLAAEAGRAALEDAGLGADALDAVIVATFTADEITPAAAPRVAHALGTNAIAIDLNAACTGFLLALEEAVARIEAGRAEHVLVVGADAPSRFLDPTDRRTAALFGDGAGAAVVSAGAGALAPVVARSDGALADLIVAARDHPVIRMEGHDTFVAAVQSLTEVSIAACEAARIALDDVDLFVFHQANRRILDAVADRLGIERDRVVDVIADLANVSAATLPIALCAARDEGRLRSGDRVLLGAMGAGFVYGAGVMTWA
jgi:3-oxoacyl-[acyl-carrier-protein] synthase-3